MGVFHLPHDISIAYITCRNTPSSMFAPWLNTQPPVPLNFDRTPSEKEALAVSEAGPVA